MGGELLPVRVFGVEMGEDGGVGARVVAEPGVGGGDGAWGGEEGVAGGGGLAQWR